MLQERSNLAYMLNQMVNLLNYLFWTKINLICVTLLKI